MAFWERDYDQGHYIHTRAGCKGCNKLSCVFRPGALIRFREVIIYGLATSSHRRSATVNRTVPDITFQMSSSFSTPRFGCVKLIHLDKSYQLRQEQLTVKNVAKIFNLVPDTILLVSTDGTVALPNEYGHFSDTDECDEWNVEGSESTKRTSGPFPFVGRSMPSSSPSTSKWKPSSFPGRNSLSLSSSSPLVCTVVHAQIKNTSPNLV